MAGHKTCPSLEVLATRFDAFVDLSNERKRNDDERREATAQELKKQALEYERRLSDLNHAHATAEKKNADYITRDLHNADIQSLTQKQDQIVATSAQKHDQAVATLTINIAAVQKLVYVGLGIVLALNLAVFVIISLLKVP